MSKRKIKFNNKIEAILRWPILYIAIITILMMIAILEESDYVIFYVSFFVLAILSGFVIILLVKKNLMSQVVDFALKLGSYQKDVMTNFELPYIILDSLGKIHWSNNAFNRFYEDNIALGKNIKTIIPELSNETLLETNKEQVERIIAYKENIYRVVIKYLSLEDIDEDISASKLSLEDRLYIAYFFNITREYNLEIENQEQKGIIGLLYVDNFDEVLHSIEEVRRPILIALIDRSISKFITEIDGVSRKFEKDKYLIMFRNKHLDQIKEGKFDILDKVREINIGNEMAVTLSIGIGIDELSYSKELDFARIAMDLALGRGGDQAVIKNNEKLSFYGGKTRGVEKTTRVKARVKAHAFRELIEVCDRVLIMGHKVQDMDSLGAAMGIYACTRHLDKPAHIIINNVTTSVRALYDKIVDDEEYNDDLFLTGQEAFSYIEENTLLVVVDVNRASYVEQEDLLKAIKNVVVFDHHRVSAEHIDEAVLSYVEPYASSTCEMVTEILRYISDNIKLKTLEADALFAGISVDTKNFVDKAGVKTFEAAAFLRRSGADVVRVRKLFKNDMASYKAKATAVRDAQIYRDNMAITICPSDVTNPNLVGAQAADELLNIADIKASFVLTQVDDMIYISSRSLDDINVQLIMEKLGGGGHLSVAGAQLKGYTFEEAIKELKVTIDEYIKEGEE